MYGFEALKEKNKYFSLANSIEDIYAEIAYILNNKLDKVILEEETNKISLKLPLEGIIIKNIKLEIDEKIKNDKEKIIELYSIISSLNNKIKTIENNCPFPIG